MQTGGRRRRAGRVGRSNYQIITLAKSDVSTMIDFLKSKTADIESTSKEQKFIFKKLGGGSIQAIIALPGEKCPSCGKPY